MSWIQTILSILTLLGQISTLLSQFRSSIPSQMLAKLDELVTLTNNVNTYKQPNTVPRDEPYLYDLDDLVENKQALLHALRTMQITYGRGIVQLILENMNGAVKQELIRQLAAPMNSKLYRVNAICGIINQLKSLKEQEELKTLCFAISTIDVKEDVWQTIDFDTLWSIQYDMELLFVTRVDSRAFNTSYQKALAAAKEIIPDANIFQTYTNTEDISTMDDDSVLGFTIRNKHSWLTELFKNRY